MPNQYQWLLQPLDVITNQMLANSLPEENFIANIKSNTGECLNLWLLNSYGQIGYLKTAKARFKVFFRLNVDSPVREAETTSLNNSSSYKQKLMEDLAKAKQRRQQR